MDLTVLYLTSRVGSSFKISEGKTNEGREREIRSGVVGRKEGDRCAVDGQFLNANNGGVERRGGSCG